MIDRVIKMLETEKACVERQDRKPKCNRYCENCDLCMPIEEVIDGYNKAIKSLKNQKSIIEELEKIKAEIMATGNWKSKYEISDRGVIKAVEIIDNHISELKGEQ